MTTSFLPQPSRTSPPRYWAFALSVVSLLSPCGTASAQTDLSEPPHQLQRDSEEDQSAVLQAALDQAGANGGGRVTLPAGTFLVKGIAIPNKVAISGQGIGATTLKLPDGANTFLLASSTYAQNKSWANMYGGLENLTLDGNKANNQNGSLLVIKGYRFLARNCCFKSSPLHGVLLAAASVDGTRNDNGMAENRIVNCSFDRNAGAGVYGSAGNVADDMIFENNFNGNGDLGYYQIDLQRSAGFHIVGNQMYAAKLGDLRAPNVGALLVRGNNFDGTANQPVDGTVRQVVIGGGGGWGTCVITGNLFHNHVARDAKPDGEWIALSVASHADNAIAVTGNVFRSQQIEVTPYVVVGRAKETVVVSGNALPGSVSQQQPPQE